MFPRKQGQKTMIKFPTVSCIMPTFNRRELLALAVNDWRRQTYPYRELIIIDDSLGPVIAQHPDDSRIKHIRLGSRRSIGWKFNEAIGKYATGSLMALWADDDYQGEDRLIKQVDTIRGTGAQITGLDWLFHYDVNFDRLSEWRWAKARRSDRYFAGGSLMFTRQFWADRNFNTAWGYGEDTEFLRGRMRPGIGAHGQDYSWYVAMIHRGNSSPKNVNYDTDNWIDSDYDLDSIMPAAAREVWLPALRRIEAGEARSQRAIRS